MKLQERIDLSSFRLDKAYQMVRTAYVNVESNDYASACNRSYYAIFHAMRAVLALDGVDEHRHSHLISEFRKNYLKTNILDRALSDIIGNAFQVRNESDYDDFWVISKNDTLEQIQKAEEFVRAIEIYLSTRGVPKRG